MMFLTSLFSSSSSCSKPFIAAAITAAAAAAAILPIRENVANVDTDIVEPAKELPVRSTGRRPSSNHVL